MSNYLDIEDASAIMAERLYTEAWDNASDIDRTKALTMATKIIDTLNFNGEKTDLEQSNEFPRGDDTEIPQSILEACAEIALALLNGVDPQFEYENLAVNSHAFANVTTTYARQFAQEHLVAGVPSTTAWKLLLPYLRDVRTVGLLRAT